MKFLIVIIIVLVIITLAQLMKVYEFSSRLRNKEEADVTKGETKFNAGMLLLFYLALMISSTYLFFAYGPRPGLGKAAAEHGESVDLLYDVNWVIILIVFYLTQSLLFIFAIKYHHKAGRKAVFFAHSTKLELVWTIIPAVTLAGIIIGGLSVWNDITAPKENTKIIEIYAKQFDWTVRYSGEDNKLGNSDFKVINSENPLGVVTTKLIDYRNATWAKEYVELSMRIGEMDLKSDLYKIKSHKDEEGHVHTKKIAVNVVDSLKTIYNNFGKDNTSKNKDIFEGKTFEEYSATLQEIIESDESEYYTDQQMSDAKDHIKLLGRQIERLAPLRRAQSKETDKTSVDDVIVKELYLVKGVDYEFKFRSRDVIHSALFPQFRAQMNCVPGMVTRFSFKPTISTADMRKDPVIEKKYKVLNKKRLAEGKEEVEFNYLLLCNKICGASHYNMQLNIVVVETQAEFDKWYEEQKKTKTFPKLAGLLPEVKMETIIDSTSNIVDTIPVITPVETGGH